MASASGANGLIFSHTIGAASKVVVPTSALAPPENQIQFSNIRAYLGSELVATAGLHPVGAAVRRRHVMMLGISVAPHAQGKGVGNALMTALCDYADNWAGILRIELTVFDDNARAVALYRKFGFELEGTHRAYAMRAGRYVTALTMARLHPQQPAVKN